VTPMRSSDKWARSKERGKRHLRAALRSTRSSRPLSVLRRQRGISVRRNRYMSFT